MPDSFLNSCVQGSCLYGQRYGIYCLPQNFQCFFTENSFAPHNPGQLTPYPFLWPVPPSQAFQSADCCVVEAFSYRSCRHSAHYRVRRHVLCHHGAGSDDGPVADVHARHDYRLEANPYVVAYYDVALVVPGRGHVGLVKFPFVVKQRECVC